MKKNKSLQKIINIALDGIFDKSKSYYKKQIKASIKWRDYVAKDFEKEKNKKMKEFDLAKQRVMNEFNSNIKALKKEYAEKFKK